MHELQPHNDIVQDESASAEALGAASGRLGERGANLVEYALLVAFIAIVCIAAVTALGNTTSVPYSSVGSAIGA